MAQLETQRRLGNHQSCDPPCCSHAQEGRQLHSGQAEQLGLIVVEEDGVEHALDEGPQGVGEEHEGEGAVDAEHVVQEVLAEPTVEEQVEVVAGTGTEDEDEAQEHSACRQGLLAEAAEEQDLGVAVEQEGVLLDVALDEHLQQEAAEGEDAQVAADGALVDLEEEPIEQQEEEQRVGQSHQEELELAAQEQVVLALALQVGRVGELVVAGQPALHPVDCRRHLRDDLVLLVLEHQHEVEGAHGEGGVVVVVEGVEPDGVGEQPGGLEVANVDRAVREGIAD